MSQEQERVPFLQIDDSESAAYLRQLGRMYLRQQFAGYEAERRQASRRRLRLLSAAAAVLVALAVGLWWLTPAASVPSPPVVFSQYYESYPEPAAVRGAAALPEASEQLRLYTAVELLGAENAEVSFLKAEFSSLAEESPLFELQAKWYLSLAYLKWSKPEEAVPLWRELVAAGDYRSKEARELLGWYDDFQ